MYVWLWFVTLRCWTSLPVESNRACPFYKTLILYTYAHMMHVHTICLCLPEAGIVFPGTEVCQYFVNSNIDPEAGHRLQAIFWLDPARAHDCNIISKVRGPGKLALLLVHFAWMFGPPFFWPTTGLSIEPLKVKLLAGEQKATELLSPWNCQL